MLQERIAVTHNQVGLGPFGDAGVAASQSDVQLALLPLGNTGIVMPKAGYVVGTGWTLSAAATAGSLTIGVSVDGTEEAATTQVVSTASAGYDSWKSNGAAPRFAAGQQVGVQITTDGDWDATAADLAVFVYVVFERWEF